MAGEDIKRTTRRKHHQSSSRKSRNPLEKHDVTSSVATSTRPPDLDALGKARLDYIERSSEEKSKSMKYVYDAPLEAKSRVVKEDKRGARSTVSLNRRKSEEPRKRRRRKISEYGDAQSDDGYVYGRLEDGKVEKEKSKSKSKSRDYLAPKATTKKLASSKATERREAPRRRYTEPAQRRNSCPAEESSVVEEILSSRRRTIVVEDRPRPTLKRSATIAEAPTEVSTAAAKSTTTPSKRKDSSLFSGLLLPTKPPTLERKTSCLTCGADDIPFSKSARLPCKHRMCHTCLRRIFRLSITDPAHMPPRCCTEAHIDLRHVDKLFDQSFKRTWNRKFLEYKTKNKIYCVTKGCGEWIKPNHITTEHGRKIGKCKRCGTRVCAICNNKAHTSRDCPKDPETKQFIETAKQKGWQKCYSCSAMVELKEGCNHMTCRCTAEFCMVCGLKWKSCDCAWFNYENVDAHLGNPIRYQEELDRRRDQEERDEALARRMQALGVDGQDARAGAGVDVFGFGNGTGNHMNQNFFLQAREALTANLGNAEQAARGILGNWVTGRENRLPAGIGELPDFLRPAVVGAAAAAAAGAGPRPGHGAGAGAGGGGRWNAPRAAATPERDDPAEDTNAHVRPVRRGTNRRRSAAIVDLFAMTGRSQTAEEAEQERRIQDWANGVRA